ncbi:MAG: ABC transporter ATP-binding protein [Verrucomicrobia bacterium]|nr:ABC transporter ATP-binding protein [Verrucomicrobiota bacterium]
MLRIEQLTKTFHAGSAAVHAVRGASVEVRAGEYVAVQGPSGCGKSTLLMMAGGLLRPDHGRVIVDGADLYALGDGERASFRAQRIGFVFQRFHLVPYLNVVDNVLAVTLARDIPRAREHAMGLLERFGLTPRIRHYPSQLSTGERQRVALARALLAQPKLVLADEPTGNLDLENGTQVLTALAEAAKLGVAVVLVTHDPEAASFASRTVRMRQGQVVA